MNGIHVPSHYCTHGTGTTEYYRGDAKIPRSKFQISDIVDEIDDAGAPKNEEVKKEVKKEDDGEDKYWGMAEEALRQHKRELNEKLNDEVPIRANPEK